VAVGEGVNVNGTDEVTVETTFVFVGISIGNWVFVGSAGLVGEFDG
jgi:hypothetical protein